MCAAPRRAIFWTSCMLILPGILFVYFSNPFFTSPKAAMTTGTIMVFVSHILLISTSRSLYFDRFSVTLVEVLRSDGMVMSMRMHSVFAVCLMMISGLFAVISLSVWMGMSHRMVISSLLVMVLGWCPYLLSAVLILCSLQIFQSDRLLICRVDGYTPSLLVLDSLWWCGLRSLDICHIIYIVGQFHPWWCDGGRTLWPDSSLVQLWSSVLFQLTVWLSWAIC